MRTVEACLWMGLAVGAGAVAAVCLFRTDGGADRPRPPADTAQAQGTAALTELREALVAVGQEPEWERLVETVAVPGLEDAVPLLLELLKRSPDEGLPPAVLRALEKIGGKGGVEGLVFIARRYPPLREQAATRLSRLEERPAAQLLVRVAEEEDRRGELAAAAVRALGRTGLRRYVPFIVELSRDPADGRVRREAVESLGRIADPEAVGALADCLGAGDARLRRSAIRALGRIRSAQAIAVLEEALAKGPEDSEKELIQAALDGLRGIQRSPFR